MHENDELDSRLISVFKAGIRAPTGDGFRTAVIARIERRSRYRLIILAISVVLGLLIALPSAYDLLVAFSNRLSESIEQLSVADWQLRDDAASMTVALALALAFLSPVFARLFED